MSDNKFADFYGYIVEIASAKWTDVADGKLKEITDNIEKAAREGQTCYTTDPLPSIVCTAIVQHPVMKNFSMSVLRDNGEFKTGSRIIPIVIVDCRGVRTTVSNGSFTSGKSTTNMSTVLLTDE